MAIGDASVEGRHPWVNLFYPLPDQVKRKRREIRNFLIYHGRNDGRLMPGSRRRVITQQRP